MDNAYIYGGLRTPFGRHSGSLAGIRPDDLLGDTIAELLKRGPFKAAAIEDVIAGCSIQAGEDSRNVARHAALLAGLPTSVAGATVHRQCGSGLQAVLDASRCAELGLGDLFIAGGVESQSRGPFVLGKGETPYSRKTAMFDSTGGSRFPNPKMKQHNESMPQTSDNIGRDHGIGREESDVFAAGSQQRYAKAKADGFYKDELRDVTVTGRKGDATIVAEDEHPRSDTTVERLAKLPAINPNGVTTAGNASGVNDGAAALFVGTRQAGERAGAKPLVRVVAGAVAGIDPRIMGLGPVPASKKALERAGLTIKDMDVIEINEAFATQVLGCLKLLGVPFDDGRVNPNGGAIAIGHPLGASGARLALTATRELVRRQGRYALVSLCVGIGQGIAAILERVK
ncbi:MAG: acetyl-CoA C-acyltransferase [Rhodospirillales bacterium]|nr:acetyl-CoA C-acyltransferase [Rhodospirillales bacterium]